MNVNGLKYVYDMIEQINRPTLYPGEDTNNWSLPEDIETDFIDLTLL